MKIKFFYALVLGLALCCSFNVTLTAQPQNLQITGQRWNISRQCFASHDIAGTDLDTVQALPGDYIYFAANGMAYAYFQGQYDTLEYQLIGKDSLSFGDTPFRISYKGDELCLYQNEEEQDGAYNRVTYILSKKEELLQSNNR